MDSPYDGDSYDDDVVDDTPPPGIGNDERRMQVRAYNYWASLLDNRNFPSVEDLDPRNLPDFGPNGVLLDFSLGVDDPAIAFLGERLAAECGASGLPLKSLADVPARSLLSRITDHYMQILSNQAPIGFEAEFVNQRGQTILYRGILLPFSSDDETIDFIFGVINWKEMAEAHTADELLLEIDQALEAHVPATMRLPDGPMDNWADGPGSPAARGSGEGPLPAADLPRPSFGLDDEDESHAPLASLSPWAAAVPDEEAVHALDTSGMGLADLLDVARRQANEAHGSEDRTRNALYEAIGRAHDFALAAEESPDEFASLVEESGLKVQSRAPMTPVVKLVFGADYDKTRLTEYATALTHARRIGLGRGALVDFLWQAEGGLKGVVKEERRLRREESGRPTPPASDELRPAIARSLREMPQRELDAIATQGGEFALVMIRRNAFGEISFVGEVPEDVALLEKAARKLID